MSGAILLTLTGLYSQNLEHLGFEDKLGGLSFLAVSSLTSIQGNQLHNDTKQKKNEVKQQIPGRYLHPMTIGKPVDLPRLYIYSTKATSAAPSFLS